MDDRYISLKLTKFECGYLEDVVKERLHRVKEIKNKLEKQPEIQKQMYYIELCGVSPEGLESMGYTNKEDYIYDKITEWENHQKTSGMEVKLDMYNRDFNSLNYILGELASWHK